MIEPDYTAAKSRSSTDYKSDKTACATLAGIARDICIEEAKAMAKVARAELEYGGTGKASDRSKVPVVNAEWVNPVVRMKLPRLHKSDCETATGHPVLPRQFGSGPRAVAHWHPSLCSRLAARSRRRQ